ncbi:13705_t:CDS:2, partial [Acaulospora colombiana]
GSNGPGASISHPFIFIFEKMSGLTTSLNAELLQLSNEARRKHPEIKESSVKTILKTLNDIMSQGVDIQLKILQTVPPLLRNYQALHGDLLAEPDNPLWQRVIAMEIFRGICVDGKLLRSIYNWYDKQGSSTHVFRDMINVFGKLAAEKPQVLGVSSHSLIGHSHQGRESIEVPGMTGVGMGGSGQVEAGLNIANSTMKVQCVDQLDKVDPPPIPETYLYYLALLCLNSIADGLHNFVLTIFTDVMQKHSSEKNALERQTLTSTFSTNSSSPSSSPQMQTTQQPTVFGVSALKKLESHSFYKEILLVTEMANTAWPGLLAAQSFFLTTNLDDELFSGVLRAYQNFTIVCGVLQLSTPRDAFLTSLCKGAVPPSVVAAFFSENKATHGAGGSSGSSNDGSLSVTLSDRNLSCLKILLNIAQYLGGVLGESWYLVLETLQLADYILFPKHGRSGTRSRRLGSQNAASTSVTSLSSPHTAGSSNSSLLQSSNTPPGAKRSYSSGVSSYSPQQTSIGSSTQAGSSATHLVPQQTAIENDLNILLNQIKKLFDNCKYLDDNALQFFTRSLCKLNAYTWGLPLDGELSVTAQESVAAESKTPRYTPLNTLRGNKSDEKSFAIEKLRSVSLLDGRRLIAREPSLIWNLIVSHLITTANYISTPHAIRMQACEALAEIIITSMSYASSAQMENDERIQMQLLVALNQLVNNSDRTSQNSNKGFYIDVQKMGLETLNKLLQTSGHSFVYGWGMIFDMIKSVCSINNLENEEEGDVTTIESQIIIDASSFGVSNTKTSGLVRVAFPSLQLICTDFLSLLSPECLKQCINTLGAFGLQMDDLNISLTAIGLLWNVSDFIQIKRAELEKNSGMKYERSEVVKDVKIEQEIETIVQGELTPHTMNALWMLLLLQLSKICSDTRPEVRNGANQTLFRTVDMNGAVLETQTWHTCIWQVLFPLLDSIQLASEKAVRAMHQQQQAMGSEKHTPQKELNGFMIHHSRNTIEKQWDETKVLVLTGISGIVRNFLPILLAFQDFREAWELLLSHLHKSCLYSNQEVAIASIKSLNTIIQFHEDETNTDELRKKVLPFWQTAWIVWEKIGLGIIASADQKKNEANNVSTSPPTDNTVSASSNFIQETVTAYIISFGDLYKVIRSTFSIEEIRRLLKVVQGILTYPNSPS